MTIHSTRRQLLAGIPAAAVVATIPAVALAVPADRRAWEHAMAVYQRAKAEDDAFEPIYQRVHAAWEAGKPSMDMIDWRGMDAMLHERAHMARVIDLDMHWQRFLEGEGKWWWARDAEARRARMRAALDSVQAFRDAEAAHNRDSGMDATDARYGMLGDALADALDGVMATPAPDLAALRWKLDYLTDNGAAFPSWSGDFVRQTLADMSRLLPQGR